MKPYQYLIAVLALLVVGGLVVAQEPTRPPAIVAQPTAEQKARLTELARSWEKENREAETARDKFLIALMQTYAELGLKPSETSLTWNAKGEPVFGRTEQAAKPPTKESKP